MITRCYNANYHAFPNYGARGITVCDRWRAFENFLADMGECPDGMSLDRIDNNGPYSPENCRWADQRTQTRNQRGNRLITVGAETLCLSEWAERTGLKREAISRRLQLGWPPEKALFTPSRRT